MGTSIVTDVRRIRRRLLRKAVRQGRSKRRGESYSCRTGKPLRFTTRGITRVTFVNAAEPVRRQCLARTPLAAFVNSLLAGVTHITDIGEGQIRLSPLMGALETPRLIELDGPEP